MTARKAPLRAVTAEDAAPSKKPTSVIDAAENGTHRDLLVAMRERIAVTVSNPDCPPRDLAALTRRLQDIAKEIEQIDLRAKQEGEDAANLNGDEAWDAAAL